MAFDNITLTSTSDSLEDVQAALTGTPAAKSDEKPAEPAPVVDGAAPGEKPAEPPVTETAEQKAERETQAASSAGRRLEKRKGSIQSEIDELIRAKHDTRRDVEAEAARLEVLKRERAEIEAALAAGKAAVEKPEPAAVFDKPKPTQHDVDPATGEVYEYEAWIEALAQWSSEKAEAKSAAEMERRLAERDAKQKESEAAERARIERESASRVQQDVLAQHHTRIEEFRTGHADFDAVRDAAIPEMEAIVEELGPRALGAIDKYTVEDADNGPALLYHLMKNPDEVRRIAALPIPQQIKELGKVEARLEVATKPGPASKVVPKDTAPAPIKPVGSSPTVSTMPADDEDYQTFKARRERDLRARRAS